MQRRKISTNNGHMHKGDMLVVSWQIPKVSIKPHHAFYFAGAFLTTSRLCCFGNMTLKWAKSFKYRSLPFGRRPFFDDSCLLQLLLDNSGTSCTREFGKRMSRWDVWTDTMVGGRRLWLDRWWWLDCGQWSPLSRQCCQLRWVDEILFLKIPQPTSTKCLKFDSCIVILFQFGGRWSRVSSILDRLWDLRHVVFDSDLCSLPDSALNGGHRSTTGHDPRVK